MKDAVIIATVAAIAAHLATYLLYFRSRPRLMSEAAITRYHIALMLTVLVAGDLALVAANQWDWSAFLIMGTLPAIYSMTFLECWSLTEGSYSFFILSRIKLANGQPLNMAPLRSLGAEKLSARVNGLLRLNLVVRDGECLQITSRGRAIAAILRSALWLVHVKRNG
jgi:hypothetical protein